MVPACSICLGELNEPVSIPCGHIYCFTCLSEYANAPQNEGLSIPCPHCRQEFQLVTPDPRTLPRKYHPFIHPHIRRVFIDPPQASETTQELRRQVKALSKNIDNLRKREDTLMKECERHAERAEAYRQREKGARRELKELEQAAADVEDRMLQAETRADEVEKRAHEAETRADEAEALADEVEEKFRVADAGLQRVSTVYDDMRPKYRAAKKRIRELELELQASRMAEAEARREADALHRQAQQRALENLKKGKDLRNRCRELETELEAARAAKGPESRLNRVQTPEDDLDLDNATHTWSDGSITDSSSLGESEDEEQPVPHRKAKPARVDTPQSDGVSAPVTLTADASQSYEAPARMRVKRPLPRRARPLSDDDEQPHDATRKRPRYSEPAIGSARIWRPLQNDMLTL